MIQSTRGLLSLGWRQKKHRKRLVISITAGWKQKAWASLEGASKHILPIPYVHSNSPLADLSQEENAKLCDVFMRWLLGEAGVRLPRRREYEVSESRRVPNTESLADRLRCCLQVTMLRRRNARDVVQTG